MCFNFGDVVAKGGVDITITGMVIVFITLSLTSIFISLIPKFLIIVDKFIPEHQAASGHGIEENRSESNNETEIVVAIAAALRTDKV